MKYLTDTQTLPALGQYTIEVLTDQQATDWLFAEPPISLLYHTRLEQLLKALTLFDNREHAQQVQSKESFTPEAGDQILTCFIEAESGANVPKWFELSWEEQVDRFRFLQLTCLHRYEEHEVMGSLPPLSRELMVPPRLRVIVGEPVIPGQGHFNFQPLSLEFAQRWLTKSFRSRIRLHKQARGLELLTGTRIFSTFDPLPPLRPCDQALVFYAGARAQGVQARNVSAEVMAETFDLALISWLAEADRSRKRRKEEYKV